jgi:hypothetical protein
VVTWDTPIQKNGVIAPQFIEQLTAVGKALGQVKLGETAEKAQE